MVKYFEVRDRATCIPIMAVKLVGFNARSVALIKCGGYAIYPPSVVINILGSENITYDEDDWIHRYIAANFDTLDDGQIIDIQFILGETTVVAETDLCL